MRLGVLGAIVLCCSVGLCDEPAPIPGPVQKELEKATEQYYEAISKIEEDLCRQIDGMVDSYSARGELEIVLALEKEKKHFLETGFPPTAPVFASYRRRAQIEISKAYSRIARAYSGAIRQLTKEREIESAVSLKNEWEEISGIISPALEDGFAAMRQMKLRKAGLIPSAPKPLPPQPIPSAGRGMIPDILKGINGGLSSEQQNYIKSLEFLTDGISQALSKSSGSLYLSELRGIDARHSNMLFSGPYAHALSFSSPLFRLDDGFVTELENCKLPESGEKHFVNMYDGHLTVSQFARLLAISTWCAGKKSRINFYAFPIHNLSQEHLKIFNSMCADRTQLLMIDYDQYRGAIGNLIQMMPIGGISLQGHRKRGAGRELTAAGIPKIDELPCVIHFRQFDKINVDVLPLIRSRGAKDYPTVFFDCVMPPGEVREALEGLGVILISGNGNDEVLRKLRAEFIKKYSGG